MTMRKVSLAFFPSYCIFLAKCLGRSPSYCSDKQQTSNDTCKSMACSETLKAFKKSLDSSNFVKEEAISCPLDKDGMGVLTWSILHTLAAYYPAQPNEATKKHAENFILALAHMYPCHICADDFKENISLLPPDVTSRESFVLWVCQQHNLVNSKLGKPLVSCNVVDLDKRWRYGDEKCWENINHVKLQTGNPIDSEDSDSEDSDSVDSDSE